MNSAARDIQAVGAVARGWRPWQRVARRRRVGHLHGREGARLRREAVLVGHGDLEEQFLSYEIYYIS